MTPLSYAALAGAASFSTEQFNEGLVAIALLLGGGLTALQAASVSTGLPFTIVLLLACYAIIKGLRDEPR